MRERVLIVGDEDTHRHPLHEVLDGSDLDLNEAGTTEQALEIHGRGGTDLILTDLFLPGSSGMELLDAVRETDAGVACIIFADPENIPQARDALGLGAEDYLLKPVHRDEARHQIGRTLHHLRLVRDRDEARAVSSAEALAREQQIERTLLDALLAIANAVEVREGYNGAHVERVSKYAVATGRRMGLSADSVRNLWIAGLLHDIGKIGISDHILQKPTRLSADEDEIIRRGPLIGAEIVQKSEYLRSAAPAILHHHERWDGGGYPAGLNGEQIPIEGRILGVAEAFDAIVTTRPYRNRRTGSEAISELRREAGGQFDARVVEAFIHSLADADEPDFEILRTCGLPLSPE